MKPADFFSLVDKERIANAISNAENRTSGEIRVHVESSCPENVLDHAAFIFEKLKMHETRLRNGVLFYLSINDRKFAILGDAGINEVTPEDFWDQIKETVLALFREGKYAEGLERGIFMAGEALRDHFPYKKDDIDELSNDISYGKNRS